jgi:hypothetical protein
LLEIEIFEMLFMIKSVVGGGGSPKPLLVSQKKKITVKSFPKKKT